MNRLRNDVHAYVNDVCKNSVEYFALAYRGMTTAQKARKKAGTNFVVISRNNLLAMDETDLAKLFRVNGGETKTVDTVIQSIIDNFGGVSRAPFKVIFIEGLNYKDLPVDQHGTRATACEKMICKALGFTWCGSLRGSAAFERETGETLIKNNCVPDGWSIDTDGKKFHIEVKAVRGRFHGKG